MFKGGRRDLGVRAVGHAGERYGKDHGVTGAAIARRGRWEEGYDRWAWRVSRTWRLGERAVWAEGEGRAGPGCWDEEGEVAGWAG